MFLFTNIYLKLETKAEVFPKQKNALYNNQPRRGGSAKLAKS
jgi:hypothetical protein